MADHGPVHITSHGRTELIMIHPDEFAALAQPGRSDLERLEWKLSMVLDTIETRVLILDGDLRVRRANKAFCETFGTGLEQMVGTNVSDMMSRPSDMFIVERLAEVLRSGQPESMVMPSTAVANRTIRIQIKPWPMGVALFADDITEKARSGDRAVSFKAADATLLEVGGVGMAHVQSHGTILYASRGLAQMAGTAPEALIGVRVQNLFAPRARPTVDEALAQVKGETTRYDVEYLRRGIKAAPARLIVTPYWTAEHHACASIALHDADWEAR